MSAINNAQATLKFRHHFMRSLRDFLDNEGFIEVETPYLITANAPDPHIDPISASLKYGPLKLMQLRTSPELWLKKALSLGLPKIYELGRVFRDDPPGRAHNPEFTMLEWYRIQADLEDLVQDSMQIFSLAAQSARDSLNRSSKAPISFKRESVSKLFKDLAEIDLDQVLTALADGEPNTLQEILQAKGDQLPEQSTFSEAFFHVMLKYIEPNLEPDQPTVISRWPMQLAALAAPCEDDPRYCGRFEIYYQGLEIANAYQECNDPAVLLERFLAENKLRRSLNKEEFPIDYGFLASVESLPKTAGIAMGIDRLLQATLAIPQIGDLILGNFELFKPKMAKKD